MLAPAVPGRAWLAARLETSQKALALRGDKVSPEAEEIVMVMLIHEIVDLEVLADNID